MNKLKLKYFIVLISLLLIGWTIYMLSVNRIYMYDVMEEELVDVTSYYDTGKFYFYTDPESATKQRQRLIRRQPPKFWDGQEIVDAIKNKTVRVTFLSDEVKNQQQVVEQIIKAFPDFSERMQYYSSYVSYDSELSETYHGFFTLDGKEYTLSIIELSDTANKTNFNDMTRLVIKLSTDFFPFSSSYEDFLEEAKKQPQPPL